MVRLVFTNLDGLRHEVSNTDGLGRAFAIPPAGGVILLTEDQYERARAQITSYKNQGLVSFTTQSNTDAWKAICASTGPLPLSGLTAIDGTTPPANEIVLVKDQIDPKQNGLYVASAGTWTRVLDAENQSVLSPGMTVTVLTGLVNGDLLFLLSSDSVVIGVDDILFSPVSLAVGGPPGGTPVQTGWLSITDVAVSGGTASGKSWDDPPNNTIIQSCTVSGLNLLVTVKSSAPRVTVGGSPFILPPHASGGYYVGTVAVTILGTMNLTAQLTSADGVLGALDTVVVTFTAAPTITSLLFTGPYPGAQTELKAGDVYQVSGTTNIPAVAVEVQDFGAGILQTITFPSTTSFVVNITIADRGTSVQSLAARLKAKDSNGALGGSVDTSNTVQVNNRFPAVTFGTKTYPISQSALKNSETADVGVTLTDLSTVLFDSNNGDLSILNPTVVEAIKTVTRISGSYNVATNNLRATANRAANNATTVVSTVIAIANVAPTVDITVPAARLRSGGNNGTAVQGHTVSVVSNQQLYSAPSLAGSGGTFIGGGFAGGPLTWTRTLNVHDNDTKGAYSFSALVATGLSGLVQNTINSGSSYTLGGFVPRTLTFAAFSQSTTLNVGVVTYAKLQAGTFTSTASAAIRNAAQGDHSNLVNTFTVDSLGNVGPTNLWWNDVAAAGANSGGTAAITAVEEIV